MNNIKLSHTLFDQIYFSRVIDIESPGKIYFILSTFSANRGIKLGGTVYKHFDIVYYYRRTFNSVCNITFKCTWDGPCAQALHILFT